VNPLLVRAISAQRKVQDREPLDSHDAEIIDLALKRQIREARVPFVRHRDHFIIGTERWKPLDGLDYYRTILLHRKPKVWYPESEMSQLSIFAVYTSSQIEPPDPNVFDKNRGKPDDYAHELLDRAYIGPDISSSYQKLLEEAPADWRIDAIGTVQQNLRDYAKELGKIDSELAAEKADELEAYLRNCEESSTKTIPDGELEAVADAYLRAQFYRGKPRPIRGPKQKVCDNVRTSCRYVRKKMLESGNPTTRDIAKHLNDYVVVGQTCEYKGHWKWRF
jgi:hypothetical protein